MNAMVTDRLSCKEAIFTCTVWSGEWFHQSRAITCSCMMLESAVAQGTQTGAQCVRYNIKYNTAARQPPFHIIHQYSSSILDKNIWQKDLICAQVDVVWCVCGMVCVHVCGMVCVRVCTCVWYGVCVCMHVCVSVHVNITSAHNECLELPLFFFLPVTPQIVRQSV